MRPLSTGSKELKAPAQFQLDRKCVAAFTSFDPRLRGAEFLQEALDLKPPGQRCRAQSTAAGE